MVLKVVFSVLFNIFSFLFEFLVCDWFLRLIWRRSHGLTDGL